MSTNMQCSKKNVHHKDTQVKSGYVYWIKNYSIMGKKNSYMNNFDKSHKNMPYDKKTTHKRTHMFNYTI